jgi:tungstate transport system substrate-binding protein
MKQLILGALLALSAAGAGLAGELRLAGTTAVHNSGLSDVLLPRIAADTGIEVQLLVVGTGQAIRLGEAGDVDAILVHSRQAEQAFLDGGFGTHRREIMYNDFVFIGPQTDPAGVGQAGSAAAALAGIAAAQADFVSRGDDSGTHKKELSLWEAAGVTPNSGWYKPVGAGMGAALNTAAGMGGYIMSDRASWLNFANKAGQALLFAGDPVLFNQYAFLPVNPGLHPHTKPELTAKLEAWLVSDTAKELINGYRIGGDSLFTFNAE